MNRKESNRQTQINIRIVWSAMVIQHLLNLPPPVTNKAYKEYASRGCT